MYSKKCLLTFLRVTNYFTGGSLWRTILPTESSIPSAQLEVGCELALLTHSLCLAGSSGVTVPSCCITLLHSLVPRGCENLENLTIQVTSPWPGSDTHRHLILGSRNSPSPHGVPNAAAHRPLLSRRTRNRFSFICSSGNKVYMEAAVSWRVLQLLTLLLAERKRLSCCFHKPADQFRTQN